MINKTEDEPSSVMSRRQFLQTSGALGLATATGGMSEIVFAGGKKILKVRSYSDMRSLDPAFSQGVTDEEIHSCIYSKLIQYQPGSKWGYQLDAAESIKQVSKTRIDFKLKRGIMFSGGFGEMTVEDVNFSFERFLDEELKSPNRPDWGTLKFIISRGKYDGSIEFTKAFPPAWSIALPYIVGNIVSHKAWEQAGGKIGTTTPCGSGPYLHQEWQPKQKTILVRNPNWFGGSAEFDEIHILPIDDENSALIAYEAGDIDYTRVPLASVARLKASPPANSTLEEYPSLFYVWVGMNIENEKLADPNLRKAIQYAIDVPAIMQAAYFDAAKPSTGMIAPGLIGHRQYPLIPPQANIEKAKEYLAAAGMSNGVSLTLDILNKPVNVTTAQVIRDSCSQAGINIEVKLHESGDFWSLGDASSGEKYKNIQLILNRYSSAPDPSYAMAWFVTDQIGIWNWEHFSDAEFDKLEAKAKLETSKNERAKMYEKMQDIMEQSGAYRFITHEATPVIYNASIKPAFRPDGLPLFRYFTSA